MLGQYSNKYSRRHDIDEITKCIEEQASLCHVEQRLLECFRGDMKKVIRSAVTKKAKREKAVAVGHDIPPKSFKEAFSNHPKDMEWIKSANTEMQGLSDNEVVDHDYTFGDVGTRWCTSGSTDRKGSSNQPVYSARSQIYRWYTVKI